MRNRVTGNRGEERRGSRASGSRANSRDTQRPSRPVADVGSNHLNRLFQLGRRFFSNFSSRPRSEPNSRENQRSSRYFAEGGSNRRYLGTAWAEARRELLADVDARAASGGQSSGNTSVTYGRLNTPTMIASNRTRLIGTRENNNANNIAMHSFALEPNMPNYNFYEEITKTVDAGKVAEDAKCPISLKRLSEITKPVALRVKNPDGKKIFHLICSDSLVRQMNASMSDTIVHPFTGATTTKNDIKENTFKINQK